MRRHTDYLDIIRIQGPEQPAARLILLLLRPQIVEGRQNGGGQPVAVAAASV
jgi:hypothetical protein